MLCLGMHCNVLCFIVQSLQDHRYVAAPSYISTASAQADSVPVLETGGGGEVLSFNFPNDLLPGILGLLGHEVTQLLLHPPELEEVR